MGGLVVVTPYEVTPQSFAYTFYKKKEALQEEAQQQFLLLASPLVKTLGIESFGWTQEFRYNDEGYVWEYAGAKNRWGHEIIYINGKWYEDIEEDTTEVRKTLQQFLSQFDAALIRDVFGASSITIYADRMELKELEGKEHPDFYDN